MKKTITLMTSVCLALAANAQVNHKSAAVRHQESLLSAEPASENLIPSVQNTRSANPTTAASGIKVRPLGQEPNAFGTIGNRTYLWADPSINAIILSHRDTSAGNSGAMYYDMSKDMGKTFKNNIGPVYKPNGSTNYNARYPQGVIYNPAGNTIADSAYEAYFAPTLDNSNPSGTATWGGVAFGVHQLSGLHPSTMNSVKSSTPAGIFNLIPTGMFVTKQGTIYDLGPNSPASAAYDMNDSVLVNKGTFNAGTRDFTFTTSKVSVHTAQTNKNKHMYADGKIYFADDGMTGYITTVEKLDYMHADSALGIVVHKTTDGGTTWGAPIYLDPYAADYFLLNAKLRYTAGFDHDAAVDGNGNLHIFVNINKFDSAQGYSTYLAGPYVKHQIGLFDIYTKDGGLTWNEKLVGSPNTFEGTFGATATAGSTFGDYNRPQVSRTYNGGKQLFFTWFDTDTLLSTRNIYPDMWSVGYDVTTNKWTAPKNFTKGTAADGTVRQGMVSYYVFSNAGTYTIPCAYVGFPNNDTSKTTVSEQLNYIDSAQFVSADFNIVDNSVPLVLGVHENSQSHLQVSQNYPNPFTNQTNVDISLTESSDLVLEVCNTLGQTVLREEKKALSAGLHTITMDCAGLGKGIYFYSIRTAGSIVTKRMIVK
jgi:hypothetical protein